MVRDPPRLPPPHPRHHRQEGPAAAAGAAVGAIFPVRLGIALRDIEEALARGSLLRLQPWTTSSVIIRSSMAPIYLGFTLLVGARALDPI